jgi:hypothetical protein
MSFNVALITNSQHITERDQQGDLSGEWKVLCSPTVRIRGTTSVLPATRTIALPRLFSEIIKFRLVVHLRRWRLVFYRRWIPRIYPSSALAFSVLGSLKRGTERGKPPLSLVHPKPTFFGG